MSLQEIGSLHNTDKVSHGFCKLYDDQFTDNRQDITNVLEIGVYFGASILMWRDYFPNATIHGIDTFEGLQGNGHRFNDADRFYNRHKQENLERIKLYKVDQSKEDELLQFATEQQDISFDFILDDGSHLMKDQQITLKYLFPLIKPGGCFIMEDLHSSMAFGDYDVLRNYSNTTFNMLKHFTKTKELHSVYIDMSDIESMIDEVIIKEGKKGSFTSFIIKKLAVDDNN